MKLQLMTDLLILLLLVVTFPGLDGRLVKDIRKVTIRRAAAMSAEVDKTTHIIHGRQVNRASHGISIQFIRPAIADLDINSEYETFDEFILRMSKLKQSNDVLHHYYKHDPHLVTTSSTESPKEEMANKIRKERFSPYPKKFNKNGKKWGKQLKKKSQEKGSAKPRGP